MVKVCVIIPCYNEEYRISLDKFKDFADRTPMFDFCFVNDGSSDRTGEVLGEFVQNNPGRFYFFDQQPNRGKAEAVRNGINYMSGVGGYDYLGFLDAEMATPLEELPELMKVTEERKKVKMVMGARLKRLGANVQRKNTRHYMGRVFATAVSVLFSLPVYDSQCGAKLIEASLASRIFDTPFHSQWLFDVELLLRVRRIYPDYTHIIFEYPLNEWIEKGGSKIRFSHLLRMPGELFKIYRHYR